ncbi:hypothetical protein D3C76_1456070 [compost metagenome]
MVITSPLVRVTLNTTLGAVVISAILNSRSIRSWMISMWRSPRKPQRKPKPRAVEDSGSNFREASLSTSFSKASRRSLYSVDSIGYKPQYTMGLIFR